MIRPGVYRTRDGSEVTICFIRTGLFYGFDAIGWCGSNGAHVSAWTMAGAFCHIPHRLDLMERIGDLP